METEDAMLMEAIVLKNSGSMTGPSKATGWLNKAFQLVVVVRPARESPIDSSESVPHLNHELDSHNRINDR